MQRLIKILLTSIFSASVSYAQTVDEIKNNPDFKTTEEILAMAHAEKPTSCASKLFTNALYKHRNEVNVNTPEFQVRAWARETMTGDAEILRELIQCPELQNIADTTTVVFDPISFEFEGGERKITINYSTQPKVLKQKLMIATKRSLPNGDANPKLMDPDDPAKYLNTEPAWYAIMVVQHDSLKDFVGDGKNNTLSMKYLDEHIGDIYPHGYWCTSRSAWANDKDTINQVVHEVVDIKGDTNDYYVAGDINLEWVMYAEIAADILITVATAGGGTQALIAAKSTRSFKTGKQLIKSMYQLSKIKEVEKYIGITKTISRHTDDIAKLEKNIENARKYEEALANIEKARKAGRDATKYEKEAEEILEAAKKIDPKIVENVLELTEAQAKSLADIDKNIARYEKQIANLQGKNPSKARELNKKIVDQKYNRNRILNQAGQKQTANGNKLNVDKIREEQKKLQENITELEKEADELLKSSDDVKQYKTQADALGDLHKYFTELRTFSRPQTGNIITRNLKKVGAYIKSIKAAKTGATTLDKAGKVARAGMSSRSAKIKNWLFDTTLKHGARLARIERDTGILYGAVAFLGEMYDKTSTTSKEFSNGIEFKPFCLLSADDIKGQGNVVNYGMWLMWTGDSVNPANDDAAYLQAMDFASKFYYQLDDFQEKNGANCNVDIYVVRPIIRLNETDIDNPSGELFYLFMNEIPWSTADQFGAQVQNLEDWERIQANLESQDPHNKYKKPEQVATQENNESDNTETTE